MTDVSVLTPSYAYGRFLEDAIVSVLRQDGVSVEHVVQDGLSPDETIDVLRRFDGQISWVSERDQGQSDALNKALSRARGRWIAWLNTDDFYLPWGLAELVRRGDATSADVVYGDTVFVGEDGSMARLVPQHPFSALILRLAGSYIGSCSAIVRRSSLPPEPWDATLRVVMDWDLYLRLASSGARFEKVDYPVGAFRRHERQVTAQPSHDLYEEHARLSARYDITPSRQRWGRPLHRGYKLITGAYMRQLRAGRFHGLDLRWFRDEAGEERFRALLRACYGRGLPH